VPYPGFHPGLVCGAPLGHSERRTTPRAPTASTSPAPPAPQRPHHNTSGQRRLFFLNGDNQTTSLRDMPPIHEAAAGSGRSEHRNVDILIPVARQRESPAGPNVPCERRTDPAEPRRGTDPQRQPRHSATAKQVRAPGGMRRSFRTHRLCAIPGVSPRAGMRCPVGALQTPHLLQSPHRLHVPSALSAPAPSPQNIGSTTFVFPQRRPSNHLIEGQAPNPRSSSGIGPERA
jgi:hypothetical protein